MSTPHWCVYGALMYASIAMTEAMTEGSTAVWRPQRTPKEPRESFWKNLLMCWVIIEEWKGATWKRRSGKIQ